jgi:hypothetical protein
MQGIEVGDAAETTALDGTEPGASSMIGKVGYAFKAHGHRTDLGRDEIVIGPTILMRGRARPWITFLARRA